MKACVVSSPPAPLVNVCDDVAVCRGALRSPAQINWCVQRKEDSLRLAQLRL